MARAAKKIAELRELVATAPRTGRPTLFNPEIAERVCTHIAEGDSLVTIEGHEGMPAARTIMRWLSSQDAVKADGDSTAGPYETFRQQYVRAREMRADARFERIDQVLLDMRAGVVDAQQARVEIDAIKWQAGKEKGKVYGDAVTLKGDKDNPLQVRKAPDLSDEELMATAAGGLRAVD